MHLTLTMCFILSWVYIYDFCYYDPFATCIRPASPRIAADIATGPLNIACDFCGRTGRTKFSKHFENFVRPRKSRDVAGDVVKGSDWARIGSQLVVVECGHVG